MNESLQSASFFSYKLMIENYEARHLDLFYSALTVIIVGIFLVIYGENCKRSGMATHSRYLPRTSTLAQFYQASLFGEIMNFAQKLRPALDEFQAALKVDTSSHKWSREAIQKLWEELPGYSEDIRRLGKVADHVEMPLRMLSEVRDGWVIIGNKFRYFGFTLAIAAVVTFLFLFQYAAWILLLGSVLSSVVVLNLGIDLYGNDQREKRFLQELDRWEEEMQAQQESGSD